VRPGIAIAYYSLLEEALCAQNAEPNHFVSRPWFELSGWTINISQGSKKVICLMEDDDPIFPALSLEGDKAAIEEGPCRIDHHGLSTSLIKQKFDDEFIYRAGDFHSDQLDGKPRIFRKSCRAFVKQHPHWSYNRLQPYHRTDALSFIFKWLGEKLGDDIHYLDQMLAYIESGRDGIEVHGLWEKGDLLGLTIADHNWHFINFRYCFTLAPYASEFIRLCFYRLWAPDTLINDGGSLDNESLRRFKEKLGPHQVRERQSWTTFASERSEK
jgi:hypothetical protein